MAVKLHSVPNDLFSNPISRMILLVKASPLVAYTITFIPVAAADAMYLD